MCGRPGLCPVTLCGSLQHSARPTSSIKSLLLKGREGGGRKGKRREGKGKWYPHFWEKFMPWYIGYVA